MNALDWSRYALFVKGYLKSSSEFKELPVSRLHTCNRTHLPDFLQNTARRDGVLKK